jgi:hypothetical protein
MKNFGHGRRSWRLVALICLLLAVAVTGCRLPAPGGGAVPTEAAPVMDSPAPVMAADLPHSDRWDFLSTDQKPRQVDARGNRGVLP